MTWDLFFFLLNLNVPKPTPFDAGVLRICAGDDPIMPALGVNPGNNTARNMLASFRDQKGQSYLPACLIVSSQAPPQARTASALRDFRNICAIATILPAYEGGQWQPKYSDHFDIYPLSPGRDGMIVTNDAIVRGLADSKGFSGQSNPLIQRPSHFTCHPSKVLLKRLIKVWGICHLAQRKRRSLQRLFRSLEIAWHACRFPTDSLMSVYDAGLRLVVWVSAFEVLLHPQGQKVALPTVLNIIRGLPWDDKRLTRRRYCASYKIVPARISLAEAVYYDLYMARNDFAHGNQVPRQGLRFRRSPSGGFLFRLAPLLYRRVLENQLDLSLPTKGIQPPPNAPVSWLLTAMGRRYQKKRLEEWADRGHTESALFEQSRA